MAVMKRLAVGGTIYDTVGEASVTQVQTSGTKIATVSIDGATTDIYAPSGSSVDPATSTPLMDGTGAVGTATKYAREDHEHPSDTAKVDVTTIDDTERTRIQNRGDSIRLVYDESESNAINTLTVSDSITIKHTVGGNTYTNLSSYGASMTLRNLVTPTNDGDAVPKSYVDTGLSGKQATLVSGTNIKTINNESLLGSGNISISGGITGVTLDTSAEPYDLPINVNNGKAELDIGDGLSVTDSSGVTLKHTTGAGYKHIPTGGSSGQFLGFSSLGTASWQTPPVTSVNNSTGAVTLSASDVGAQPTLVSGTNIKTVNSTSLLGSGDVTVQPTLVSGTNIKTINNQSILGSGNIAIESGGANITNTTVSIAVADWSNNTATKNVTGVTASNSVVVTYAPASKAVYSTADIYCSAQGAGTLTFTCTTTPTEAVTANIMIID